MDWSIRCIAIAISVLTVACAHANEPSPHSPYGVHSHVTRGDEHPFLAGEVKRMNQAGLNQRELAEALGVAQNTVHRMEIGSRRCDVVELIEWARACGASPKRACERVIRQTQ